MKKMQVTNILLAGDDRPWAVEHLAPLLKAAAAMQDGPGYLFAHINRVPFDAKKADNANAGKIQFGVCLIHPKFGDKLRAMIDKERAKLKAQDPDENEEGGEA